MTLYRHADGVTPSTTLPTRKVTIAYNSWLLGIAVEKDACLGGIRCARDVSTHFPRISLASWFVHKLTWSTGSGADVAFQDQAMLHPDNASLGEGSDDPVAERNRGRTHAINEARYGRI